jgi:hypothetical protein
MLGDSDRILPLGVLLAATALLTIIIGRVVWRTGSRSERFVVLAVWCRYILSAFHTLTYKQVAAGLSGQALGSLAVLGLGLLTIDLRNLFQRFFLPCFAIVALIVVSGLVNGRISGVLIAATKYGYFLVVAVSFYEALAKGGERQVFLRLIWAFAPLLLFQALSVALGVVKAGESDGSASYIGGYNHEAAFSVALATCLLVTCLGARLNMYLRSGLLLITLIGIYLANYRTTILAVGPLIFAYVAWPELKALTPGQRPLIRFGAMMIGAVAVGAAILVLQERMADIATAFGELDNLIKPPNAFNTEDRRLLSGRGFIWSLFIYAYKDGTDLQHILGFGPESWVGAFITYPHNTVVAYLYELGWVGVIAIIWLWSAMIYHAARVTTGARSRLLAGHVSFLLMNMATMPHWQIEGNIFYGLLCGYTLYHKRLGEALALQAQQAERPTEVEARPAAAYTG